MIFAVTRELFERLKATGELENICNEIEIRARDKVTLTERVRRGELVQAKNANKLPRGSRDRCYMPDCNGDEVTPCFRESDGTIISGI